MPKTHQTAQIQLKNIVPNKKKVVFLKYLNFVILETIRRKRKNFATTHPTFEKAGVTKKLLHH